MKYVKVYSTENSIKSFILQKDMDSKKCTKSAIAKQKLARLFS
jgi:hypothetical protein